MAQSIANQPSPSQVSGRLATWHRVMEEAGLTYDALQVPINDPDMRKRLVRFWISGGHESTTSQERVRAIMGANFFGVEEAIRHFGVNPSRQQLAYLTEVPFTEPVLEAHKDTHILVAVFPLSILGIRGLFKDQPLFYEQDWYNKEAFAKDKGKVSWRLIRKTPVADSTDKTWDEQQKLLSPDEETPQAQVMVYTIIGHFKATGEHLFGNVYVRCSNIDSDGLRVSVGYFDHGGLRIFDYFWVGCLFDYFGLATSLKFQS